MCHSHHCWSPHLASSLGEGSPQSIVGVCEVEADAVCTSAAEGRGRQEMGGGKRKPELESQTKRVTQKQRLRRYVVKKNLLDPEPCTGPSLAFSTTAFIPLAEARISKREFMFFECLSVVSLQTSSTTCGVRNSISSLEVKKQLQA